MRPLHLRYGRLLLKHPSLDNPILGLDYDV